MVQFSMIPRTPSLLASTGRHNRHSPLPIYHFHFARHRTKHILSGTIDRKSNPADRAGEIVDIETAIKHDRRPPVRRPPDPRVRPLFAARLALRGTEVLFDLL